MKALSYQGKNRVEFVDKSEPQPEGNQVVIQVTYAGICGTDLAIAAGKHPRATPPLVMGHEFSGRVVQLPQGARSDLKLGDQVTVYPLLSCGECYICKMGLPHVCRDLKLIGIDTDGAFAEYVVAAEDAVMRVPPEVLAQQGALIEPLAVCLHAARMSRLQVGDSVVVTGAGPIGLLMAEVARAAGAAQVIVTEIAPVRIAVAEEMGFTVLDAADEAMVTQILDLTNGRGGDVVFEAAGHPSVAPYLMELVRIRGQIVQVGIFKEPVALDLRALNFHEVDLIGSRVYTKEDFAVAIDLAVKGNFDLDALITQVFPLYEGEKGFAMAQTATSLKVLFEMPLSPSDH